MLKVLLMPVLVWQFFHSTLLFFVIDLIGYMRKRRKGSHNANGAFSPYVMFFMRSPV